MDAYYVIDITDNLTDLINDYNKWAMLTFDFRKRGDEECIRRHNCTNTDLFNRLRSAIIAKNSELPEGTVEDIELNEGYNIKMYHGSSTSIEGFIEPKNDSRQDGDYVFGTPFEKFALCFAGNPWNDSILNVSYYNNKLTITELQKGALKKIYDTTGYIYTLDSSSFTIKRNNREYLSKEKVKILQTEVIDNVYRRIINDKEIKVYEYPDKPSWLGNIKESVEDLMTDDFAEKVAMSRAVNNGNSICILIPGEYKTAGELAMAYMRYVNLPDNLKRQSDSYSLSIWGLSVYNMYNQIAASIEPTPYTPLYVDESYWQFCVENNIEKNGIIQNVLFDLDSCDDNIIGDEKDKYDECKANLRRTPKDFESVMNDIVPYFTPDELSEYESDLLFNEASIANYKKLVTGLMKDYEKIKESKSELKSKLESTILSLGWNPEVPITEKSIAYAKERQAKYYENYTRPHIIDISHLGESITESTTGMRREYNNHGLYPVYIVLSYNGTIFNNLVKLTQGSTYTHAGLALDSDLKKIYTFTNNKYYQGFGYDDLDIYNTTAGDKGLLSVYTIFVKKETIDTINNVLDDFVKNKAQTKYGTLNLINILFNRAKADNLQAKELVCSQFVDLVLKLSNINLTGKANNLVIPEDFRSKANPKVYKIYEGPTKVYKDKIAEKNIRTLFRDYSDTSLKYSNLVEGTYEGLDILDYMTENLKANEVIKYYRELLTPEALV